MTIERALQFFSLSPDYSLELLLQAYHKLLFEIHPDTSKVESLDSAELLEEIKEARSLLEENLLRRQEPGSVSDAARREGKSATFSGKDGYEIYRRAGILMGDAMQEYWKERLRWSGIPSDSPKIQSALKKMQQAKNLFARVLNEFPGGVWTPDAVEEIARINIWLGGKKRPFGS